MIQVLNKAFRLLEYMAKEPDRPHPLSELAEKIGASPAACSHLVKTIQFNGYLEQAEKRGGYTLGPMAYYLGRHGEYRQDLTRRITPFVQKLNEDTGETALFARLNFTKKYVLCSCQTKNAIHVDESLLYLDTIYETASGRVLLAHLNRRDRETFFREHGMPGEKWSGIGSVEDLHAVLDKIQTENVYVLSHAGEIVFMAAPVAEGKRICGAMALSCPAYRLTTAKRTAFARSLHAAAQEAEQALAQSGKQI